MNRKERRNAIVRAIGVILFAAAMTAALWGALRHQAEQEAGEVPPSGAVSDEAVTPAEAAQPVDETTLDTSPVDAAPVSNPQPEPVQTPPAALGPALSFDVMLQPGSTPVLAHKHVPLLEAGYLFWGSNWKWAGSRFAVAGGGEALSITGRIDALGIEVRGTITRPERNTWVYRYIFDAEESLSGIVGGGLEWRPALPPPSLPPDTPEPVLLPGGNGWEWQLTSSQAVRVTVENGAETYFERGNPGRIRTMLLGSEVNAGTTAVTMTVEWPEGVKLVPSPAQRYGPVDDFTWRADTLALDASPVDLSHLNDAPAGKQGFVRVSGDSLEFEDGTPVRFWGTNVAAYALFVPDEQIEVQARRLAQLGYNLVRLHHHDSIGWVRPSVIERGRDDTRHLDMEAMDRVDYWVKCLKEQGIYVWLDLHVGRLLKPGDAETDLGVIEGFSEINDGEGGKRSGDLRGFCYYNDTVRGLMKEFNRKYLTHVNAYTNTAYKDEPAVAGVLITNENDLTHHFGNLMLADKNNPVHNRIFRDAVAEFCAATGLPESKTAQTWVPGPSKIFLCDREHRFFEDVAGDLRGLGVRAPLATTNSWGLMGFCGLPSLAWGGLIDVHSYGESEALSANPRYTANYVSWMGANQVAGKPMTVTEWNVPYDHPDRFTAPMYTASIAALQGWDALMLYNYCQHGFDPPDRPDRWSTAYDPAITAAVPAAALAYRRGDIQPASKTYCLQLTRETAYYAGLGAADSAAVRTLVEQSRLTIGLPDVEELDWDRATAPRDGAAVVMDPYEDFIPPERSFVESDTGELRRDWVQGVQTVTTPRTKAASGWIGGRTVRLDGFSATITTPKAFVCVTSLDGAPISEAQRLLITAVARAVSSGGRMPLRAEPVLGTLAFEARAGLTIRPLDPRGQPGQPVDAAYQDGAYTVTLPEDAWSHWYLAE